MPVHHLPFTHRPGRHCGSTALHNAMAYHGVPYSEALCFGLGRGLGFFFARLEDPKLPRMIGGRTRTLETDFFDTVGAPWDWRRESDPGRAWANVAAVIDRDLPVLLRTDLYYLDYYQSSTHFAGHSILLVGYDTERGMAYTSDTHFPDVQAVPLDRLRQARSAQAVPLALEYDWHEIEALRDLPPLRRMMLRALHLTAETMLNGESMFPLYQQGVAGLRAFADELPDWPEALRGEWSWPTRFAYQLIERRGTGGGHFRYLYADFLREVETEAPEVGALGLSTRMQDIGRQWTALSETLKTLSETTEAGALFHEAGTQAHELAAAEQRLFEDVKQQVPRA